ncbi:MAG: AAA family ATPase [Planctomycetota bacterium]
MTEVDWLSTARQLRADCLDPIKQVLVGKDEIIEVLGVGLVAGENVFLLGPPGTAKSALVHELACRLNGQSFDYLLTRFTEPSELFGPFDLRKLRDGDLVTNTEGMLPEADFVFLDEIMNANSAVLNSLLLALNEKVFRRGRESLSIPMLLTIGASNRLPEDSALTALYDRFLLRVLCENVSEDLLGEVLDAGWRREQREAIPTMLDVEAVRLLQNAVTQIDLTRIRRAYLALVGRLREAGLPISDRRAVRLQRAIAASAVICGRTEAQVSDLWILRYIWESPAQKETICAHVDDILNEHQEESDSGAVHPLSDPQKGPDPEQLQAALETLDQELQNGDKSALAVADTLALLASRIEWVPNEEAREQLRNQVTAMRDSLQQGSPQ